MQDVPTKTDTEIGSELEEILKTCAIKSIKLEEDGKYSVSSSEFSRFVLKYWLYNEDSPGPLPPLHSAFGSYVFLLQKNIEVTNVTFPENIALIREFVFRNSIGESLEPARVEFFTTRQYRRYIERCFTTPIQTYDSNEEAQRAANRLSSRFYHFYDDFLSNTVAISPYSTSFVLHIPRCLRLDIENVVAQSGYIHSVGYQVYVALSDRSEDAQLIANLERIRKIGSFGRPIFFAPYSEEFFSGEASLTAYSMSNGLDGVKIAARKQQIGASNLLDLVETIDSFDHFVTPKTDNFMAEKRQLDMDEAVEKDVTIFLFSDHGLDYSKNTQRLRKSETQYILCYLQQLKNSNKLHIIKERKPGWTGPITIPHTLAASMVNVARRCLPRNIDKPLIFDPFCGSSTFLIESAIRFNEPTMVGVDRHPLFHCVNRDNFHFISSENSAPELRQLASSAKDHFKVENSADITVKLKKMLSTPLSSEQEINSACPENATDIDCLMTALALVLCALSEESGKEVHQLSNSDIKGFLNSEPNFGVQVAQNLNGWKSVKGRASFYLLWRAICGNSYRIKSEANIGKWIANLCALVITPEVNRAHLEYRDISSQYDNSSIRSLASAHPECPYEIFQGLYSQDVRLSDSFFGNLTSSSNVQFTSCDNFWRDIDRSEKRSRINLLSGDSLAFMQQVADRVSSDPTWNSFRPNLILTDPPYSFNVSEGDDDEMQKLFHDIVYLIPKIIAPRGVASIVVPSFSRNGQVIPFYQSNEVFTRRMLSACSAAGRDILFITESVPDSVSFPKLPYMWNSMRGVSRHIMNFVVQ